MKRVTPMLEKAIQEVIHPVMIGSGFMCMRANVYRAKWSTDEVEQLIFLSVSEVKGRETVLKSHFGLRNWIAEIFGCHMVRSYGGDGFKEFKCDEPDSCAMRSSFDRLDQRDWVVRIRDLQGREIGKRYQDFIRDYLVPTFGPVTTLQELLSLLAANLDCCPWFATNGAIRAAQIVAVARQIGLSADQIRSMLEPRKVFIANGGGGTSRIRSDPDGYITQMLDDWSAGSYNTARG